ncbi:MAG: hypothetical protein OES46_04580 [Gammaproteobacteria bacterium]|jgi:hypothetical protein|nr:hypothetical protein [Gammaproteobacteria bacterium]
MNRYQISEDDKVYAAEFKRNLDAGCFYHSPGLQRVLNVMRGGRKAGKYVLVIREPFKRWGLARMSEERAGPVEILHEYEFTDLRQAEWTVFRLRWREQTGKELDL